MDHELLRLRERVEIALEIGESYYREFKSAFEGRPGDKKPRKINEVCYDIGKTLVAFANADGGELFVGIEDNHAVTGLQYDEARIDQILNAYRSHVHEDTPLSIKRAVLIPFKDTTVAYFSLEKGAKYVHLTAKGECFQRKDRESVPTASETIRFAREEETSREYDRQFVDLASVSDLHIPLVTEIAHHISASMSPEKFLQYCDLAEFDGNRLRLRRAALLLFAKDIQRWHPRSQVRVLRVRGTEEKTGSDFNVTELSISTGNIFELIEQSWTALKPHLTETRLDQDIRFKSQSIYPEQACREALINAITHRDYSQEGRGIEIRIFDNRLEILNPGKLLSSLTLKDLEELKGMHQTRNAYVARVLREYGYVRELGEGIRRMFDLMQEYELIPPRIDSPNKSFIISFYNIFIYTKEEIEWLNHFKHLGLNRAQKTVVRLGIGGRLISPKEIFEATGIVDTAVYQDLVTGLQKKGILSRPVSAARAQSQSRSSGIPKKDIPCFQVTVA